ncbi:MAG: GAF domain-containing protein [bacterium]|nr:GAF domain-containing protein [bacterium]
MDLSTKIFEGISNIDIRLKPKEYSREVLKVICDNMGFHFGSIILVDEEGEGNLFSSYNLPKGYQYLVLRVSKPILSSPSGLAIETGKPQVVNEIYTEPRLEPWWDLLSALKVNTIVWVPLFSKGKAYGTYNLYDNRKREVSAQELTVLKNLSMLFSMAIMSNEYIDDIQEKSHTLENEIVERKEVEKQLRVAKEAAEGAIRVKDEFLTIMSHELRTPMNAVMGFAEILLMEEQDPEKIEPLTIIHSSGTTLLHLIESILEFAEIESGGIELKKTDFSMADVLGEIYSAFAEQAEKKGVLLKVKKDPAVPRHLQGDEHRVTQVLSKLVDNAIKFTEKGEVRLECSYDRSANIALIRVCDTGLGIPAEKSGAIFSVFTQVDMSISRRHEGIGLGLTIVSKLLDRMKGEVTFESTPGKGSTFTVRLPLPEVDIDY